MTRLPAAVTVLAWTTILLLVFAAPGRAQIVVEAASSVRAQSLQAWCERHIPAPFRPDRALRVRLLFPRQMLALVEQDKTQEDADGDVDGLFQDDPPRIAVRITDSDGPDVFTFAHEYGHWVWTKLFSRDDRREYHAVYQRQRARRALVTRYAQTDEEEGFAEAFSFYVNEPPLLQRRDPVSARFLTDWANARLNKHESSPFFPVPSSR